MKQDSDAKKILLVYPKYPITFWSFTHALKFIGKKAAQAPLSLITVAAIVNLYRNWEFQLVDLNVQDLSDKDITWADMVFISAMNTQRDSAHEVINRCQKMGTTTVCGGPLFLAEHESFPNADYFVLNEGEITIPLFLDDLKNNCAQRIYKTDKFADLTKSPTPMWELINQNDYAAWSVQCSRGCPFNCDFCNITAMLGKKVRIKTAQQIQAELDLIYSLGWRKEIFFVDDNFIGRRNEIKEEILPMIIDWRKDKKGIPFIAQTSINLVDDPKLMDLMTQAGINSTFIGIESTDNSCLKSCGKKQNTERDLVATIRKIQKSGIHVLGGFIIGFDDDDPETFAKNMIEFIQNSGIITAMVGILSAPFGTKLYQKMKKSKRLTSEMSGNNTDGTTNIVPKMNLTTLKNGYQEILDEIYSSRKNYYGRIKTLLKNLKTDTIIKPIFDLNQLLAFFKAIYSFGIKDAGRAEFWKLFWWSLFKKPRLLPLTIAMSIQGQHFRKCAKNIL